METTMELGTNNPWIKLGIHLVGWYFIIWGILTAIGLALSPTHAGGFFGIYTGGHFSYTMPLLGSGDFQLDLMALGKIFFLLFVGFFILRFQSPARLTALAVLWPSVIIHGIILVLMLVGAIYVLFLGTYSGDDYSATFYFFQTEWPGKVTGPVLLYSIFTGEFLLPLIPTYLLMRKDVKRLFQKPATTGETY